CRSSSAGRCCSSPTTWTRRCGWATGWRSCGPAGSCRWPSRRRCWPIRPMTTWPVSSKAPAGRWAPRRPTGGGRKRARRPRLEWPTEPPAEGLTEPRAEGLTEPPAEGLTERLTERPAEGLTEPPAEGPMERLTERPAEGPTERPARRPPERPTEPPAKPPTPERKAR